MARLLLLVALPLAVLAGCGGGKSEREVDLEQRLAAAESRAADAEEELARTKQLLVGPGAGFEDEPAGDDELPSPELEPGDGGSESEITG